ncbi:MAG: YbaK/EbsC family protein [Phycisphaerae bacterium]|jgi:Ala-tRNA(Pro) deacylase
MKVQEYLEQEGVKYETRQHRPAYTAQEVAAEEHVSGDLVAKAVVVRSNKGYAMCVVPASFKLDLEKVAKILAARQVRLADETELAELFPDCEVGAEPPLGKLYHMPTLVDEHLAMDEEVYIQAGTHRELIRIKYRDYAKLTEPTVADLTVHR